MLFVLLCSFMPQVTLASHNTPTCSLTATIANNSLPLKNKSMILLSSGTVVKINWSSKSAKTAFDSNKNSIELIGEATSTVMRNQILKYTFNSGQKKVVCEVSLKIVAGAITTEAIKNVTNKTVIVGTVNNQKNVKIELQKLGNSKVVYNSQYKTVKNGRWNIKLPTQLTDGEYLVTLRGDRKATYNIIATSTLLLGNSEAAITGQPSTLVVQIVPLLLGSVAKGGQTVPVAYLQLTNIGTATATISGFNLKQNGNADTNSIVTLSAADDTGLFKSSIGSLVQPVTFVNNVATVPMIASIAPQDTRLFTLKATLLPGNVANVGKQMKLDVIGVLPAPLVRALYPLYGTTWTLGL